MREVNCGLGFTFYSLLVILKQKKPPDWAALDLLLSLK